MRQVTRMLPTVRGLRCLDIGGDTGVIPLLLRELGGDWHSVDLDEESVRAIQSLVGDQVTRIERDGKLPFPDDHFDVVVILDMLEHLQDDAAFIAECHRVLRENGRLILNVPHYRKFAMLPPFRKLLGLSDQLHGHLRPGYTPTQIFDLLKDGFDVEEEKSYSKFFVEFIDTLVRFTALFLSGDKEPGDKGVMMDSEELRKNSKLYTFYSLLYPGFWVASQLDKLLFWTRGYYLIALGRRRSWRPRKSMRLQDGRSIAEATLNTRIGSAAEF